MAFRVKEGKKKKLYILEMLPYPSAAGLHMGHIRNYSIGDSFARFKRMQGFNVLYPMGYDAFGLPAENAAIKSRTHPKKYTERAIIGIRKNQKALGLSYDWTREIATCHPEYYRWNQWVFLKMLKRGLAYKRKALDILIMKTVNIFIILPFLNYLLTLLPLLEIVHGL